MIDLDIIKTIYGDKLNYEALTDLIKNYVEDTVNPQLEYFCSYKQDWITELSIREHTSNSMKFSIRQMKHHKHNTIIITFSTVELFMPREWRTLDKDQRKTIRLSKFKELIETAKTYHYSEGTTLIGHCKWLVSFDFDLPINDYDNISTEDVVKSLQNFKL